MKKLLAVDSVHKRFLIWTIFAVLVTELFLTLLLFVPGVEFNPKIGIAALTAIPLFVVTLMQLGRTLRLQRADFIRKYTSQFVTEGDLYSTFHDLVYNYSNKKYEEVKKVVEEESKKGTGRPGFDCLKGLQGGRGQGKRFYHPSFFQGSPEEMRLDALLGYFDILGYYYARGFVHLQDIVGTLGYYLAVLGERHVVRDYIDICTKMWPTLPYSKVMGATTTSAYLRRLLDDVKTYNEKFTDEITQLHEEQIT